MNPRKILNEIKWRDDLDLDEVEILYRHRGAPRDLGKIHGEEIVKIDRSFIEIEGANIPHHRIIKIFYKGTIIFERK